MERGLNFSLLSFSSKFPMTVVNFDQKFSIKVARTYLENNLMKAQQEGYFNYILTRKNFVLFNSV